MDSTKTISIELNSNLQLI